jgi:protein-tyrosine kinase
MVRSHDALKRGEQDREILQVVDLKSEPREAQGTGPLPVSPASGSAQSRSSSAAPALTVPMTFDDLLANCHRSTWTPDLDTMLFLGPKEQARGTEVFRALRSRLYRIRETKRLKTLLVTSSLPQEGKSFVAANLALVLALQPECKVLLIDADFRSPRLHLAFGTSATPGLGEYLLNEAEEFSIMQKGREESLIFVPSGCSVSRPTELISNGRLNSLIDRMKPLLDWIIIDSPAAIPVSDAGLLANCCDGVLMVVRSNSTPFDTVRKAREKFRDEHLLGVVLNEIGARTSPQSEYH